ncbi:MAG: type II secretion system protein [Candidatus Paceibacterota bacterium]
MKKIFKQGLTLIELMTVVSMIMIVTAIVFTTYGIGRDSMALERSSQKLYQDIRFAINNSMSGLDGYSGAGIHFDKSGSGSTTKYIIFKNPLSPVSQTFDGNSVNIFPSKGVTVSDWLSLEEGVKIASFTNASGGTSDTSLNAYFGSPYPTTYLNGTYYQNRATVSIVLSTNDGSKTKTITIYSSGMIDVR